jgi:uncharacterized protein
MRDNISTDSNLIPVTETIDKNVGLDKKYIIGISLIACAVLYFIEQSVGVSYALKTAIKLLLFVGIPIIYIKCIKKEGVAEALRLKNLTIKGLRVGLIAGALFFTIVLGAYLILNGQIDFPSIAEELQTKLKVTPLNFIFIGIYITLGNSFLEEFFFRGFIFLNLYNRGFRRTAHIYSSVLFAVYHMAIFRTWFTLPIMLLALFGLAAVGFMFNWMDTKSDNFINSWISHAFADAAIILIGMRMFQII